MCMTEYGINSAFRFLVLDPMLSEKDPRQSDISVGDTSLLKGPYESNQTSESDRYLSYSTFIGARNGSTSKENQTDET